MAAEPRVRCGVRGARRGVDGVRGVGAVRGVDEALGWDASMGSRGSVDRPQRTGVGERTRRATEASHHYQRSDSEIKQSLSIRRC